MGGAGNQSSSSSSSSESWNQSVSDYFSKAFSNNWSNAQNSSESQNTSTSENSSQSGTRASELSEAQLGILKNREDQYNNFFFPELQKSIQEQTPGSSSFNGAMEQNASTINSGFDAAQKSTEQQLAQQGLSGSRTGVGAALKAANNRARSSSLAQAYFNQLSQSQQNKASLLQTMGALMPSPTNSAEYYQSSESHGTSNSQGSSTSQGTSQSQGNSQSESGGKSESRGESWSTSNGKSNGSNWRIG